MLTVQEFGLLQCLFRWSCTLARAAKTNLNIAIAKMLMLIDVLDQPNLCGCVPWRRSLMIRPLQQDTARLVRHRFLTLCQSCPLR